MSQESCSEQGRESLLFRAVSPSRISESGQAGATGVPGPAEFIPEAFGSEIRLSVQV